MIAVQKNLTYEQLLEQHHTLKSQHQELQSQHQALQIHIEKLTFELAQIKRMIFGAKSERFVATDKNQLQLAIELNQQATAPTQEPTTQQVTYTRTVTRKETTHQGRLPIPAHIPREIILLEPLEDISGSKKIGEEVTEELHFKPGQLFVKKYVRPKYAKPNNEGVITASLPPRPIEKCMAGASLLATILVDKYVDHLPLNRQMQRFERNGMHIPSSTITDWTRQSAQLLIALADELRKEIITSRYLMVDETPIRVLDRDKPKGTHQGYYWVYRSTEKNLVLFDYQKGRGRDGPTTILEGFAGHLQTDGYQVYEQFEKNKNIQLVGCMAHARRYFDQALQNDNARATEALNLFAQLYAVEKIAREQDYTHDLRLQLRQEKSVCILAQLKQWMQDNIMHVTPQSPIGKAITYSLARWDKLCLYTTNGTILIDNNLVENSLRPLALGRKNYLSWVLAK
jgi:transposase